jgi:aminocarboxymuconate-semialdehyde decarboxylase
VDVTDVHAHAAPVQWLTEARFPHVTVSGSAVTFGDGTPGRPITGGLPAGLPAGLSDGPADRAARAAWLTVQGVDRQVVSVWSDLYGYPLPADEGADWAAQLTGALRAMCDADPRLVALATVPLQDPLAAAVAVAGSVGSATAGSVFLHPGYGSLRRRYADFGLMNGLGRIEDGTVTLARLLYAGIPARFPGLKLVVANGGDAVPYVLGRLVRNHLLDPARTRDPLESFALVYFDSVLSDSVALEFLVAKAGADHVLLGSDYPFRIGDPAPPETVGRARLTLGERELILGRTAASLFG